MAAYMKYGKVKGESLAEGHKGADGWIEVGSVEFGCGRSISSLVGSSSKREASAPSVSEITVAKMMDSTSPLLMQESLSGRAEDCEIHLTETGENSLETFLKVKLTNCLISSYSMSSGGERPAESISLNFTKVEYQYQGFDDKGKADSNKKQVTTYDLSEAKRK